MRTRLGGPRLPRSFGEIAEPLEPALLGLGQASCSSSMRRATARPGPSARSARSRSAAIIERHSYSAISRCHRPPPLVERHEMHEAERQAGIRLVRARVRGAFAQARTQAGPAWRGDAEDATVRTGAAGLRAPAREPVLLEAPKRLVDGPPRSPPRTPCSACRNRSSRSYRTGSSASRPRTTTSTFDARTIRRPPIARLVCSGLAGEPLRASPPLGKALRCLRRVLGQHRSSASRS